MEWANKWYRLSNFKLKVLAMLFMTIDHLGYQLTSYFSVGTIGNQCGDVFRYIGRLAMPLFAFMIVEGVMHTKSYKKYAGRLGLMAGIISLALMIAFILSKCGIYSAELKSVYLEGNIFMDLLLGSFLVFSLKHENKYFKLLSLIPIALAVLSFVAKSIESNSGNIEVYWFPAFLRLQYDWLSVGLIAAFFGGKILIKIYYDYQSKVTGVSPDIWKENGQYQMMENIMSCGVVVIVAAIYFAIGYFNPGSFKYYLDPFYQSVMACSGAFLLLYNGLRGYNKKWFKIFEYIYYPVHMILLAVIFILIFGL